MRDLDELFAALAASRFRGRFHLDERHAAWLRAKRFNLVVEHARRFVLQRLAERHTI